MNFCPNCGNKVNSNDKFCSNCGLNLQDRIKKIDEDNFSSTDTFMVNEPKNIFKTAGTATVDKVKENNSSLREELDKINFKLYNTLLSIFDIEYVKGTNIFSKLSKVSAELDGKISAAEHIQLNNYINRISSEEYLVTENDITLVNNMIKRYEKEYKKNPVKRELKHDGEELVVNKKINGQLKSQLMVLFRVLNSIFELNVSDKNLTDKYKNVIAQLRGRIKEEEIDKLEDRILPLCDKSHVATTDEVEMIKKMVVNFDDSYNKNHTEKLHDDSNLKEQLNYLSGQSSSAIADAEGLSDLQNYMHVKRGTLEDDLLNTIETMNSEHGKLVFLVGNVGDGKSYSIGYLKQKHPDLFAENNINIYYDATESFDPHKTAMETLIEKLDRFSDKNLQNNSENWIIAINMGVLVNFVSKVQKNGNFTTVINYLNKTGITERTSDIKNISNDYFGLISFRNYPLFTMDESGANSTFYDKLFNRIIMKTDDNPFYKAYLSDKEKNTLELTHHNFELFSDASVRQTLKFLLIKIQIESKVIISTRSLLELIHDILIPAQIKGKEMTYKDSLPYLLFGGSGDSTIIKKISAFDPIDMRNGKIEDWTTTVYNSRKNIE